MVPGQTSYRQVCETVPNTRTVTEYKTVNYQEMTQVKRCTPSSDQQCTSYQIPQYRVDTEEKSATVTLDVPQCT